MMIEFGVVAKGLVVSAILLLMFTIERWRPAAVSPPPNIARLARNMGLWGINLLSSPWLVLPLTLLAAEHALQWRGDWLSGWPSLVLDLLLLDIWLYWWHRANHEVPLLWRFHSVHHLDQWLDVSSSLRFHFGEVWLSALARGLFIVLMGIDYLSVLLFESLILIAAGFHHSNIRLPPGFERALSKIVITPSIHWVHHHVVREDTDSNYGTILSCWDRFFGTRSATQRAPDMPLGIAGEADKSFARLLLQPVKRPGA